MVLTNIELWAADGSTGSNMPLDFDNNNSHARHINPFDPRVVPQTNSNHLSSNGYYGFSYVNAAHNIEVNNNDNSIRNINNNNNTTTCNLMANDVNGMNNATATPQQTYTFSASVGDSAHAAGHAVNVARCKKRFFVMNDDDDDDVISGCTATKNRNCYANNSEVSAKRCRFDDDFSAQYFNDFFQLPSTQIATQSCLMDTEEGLQQQQQQQHLYQQQQTDVAMLEGNNNNIEKYEQQKLKPQLTTLSAAYQHEQASPQAEQQQQQQQQQPQQEQQHQHLYHQQQHYQDTQFATNKCHFSHNNNNKNNSSDTLPLNNHTSEIDLQKSTENFVEILAPNRNSSIKIEHKKYDNDDIATDLKVDDATLFAQLHGGCLHHYKNNFNSTDSLSEYLIAKKDAMNNHHHHLPDDYEEF